VRLNGWQRIGIVLSVLWFFVAGFWGNRIALEDLGAGVVATYRLCLERSIQPDDDTKCNAAFMRDYPAAVESHWWYAAGFALIPIPIAWLVVYGFVALFRWIKAGFKPT
jgi:hypothetical protein